MPQSNVKMTSAMFHPGVIWLELSLGMAKDELLWRYFRDINAAVEAGYRGKTSQPYRSGTFMVTALEGEMELTIKDISEEDAILIASELQDLGVKVVMTGSVICSSCGKRVPDQDYCINCRAKLARAATAKANQDK